MSIRELRERQARIRRIMRHRMGASRVMKRLASDDGVKLVERYVNKRGNLVMVFRKG